MGILINREILSFYFVLIYMRYVLPRYVLFLRVGAEISWVFKVCVLYAIPNILYVYFFLLFWETNHFVVKIAMNFQSSCLSLLYLEYWKSPLCWLFIYIY
jgi:hypothetical protein